MKKIINIFSLLILIFLPIKTFALSDHDMIESKKCSSLFPYFERKYELPEDYLHSIAMQESGKKHPKHDLRMVWPWTVNSEGKGYYFSSMQEAIKFTRQEIASGKTSIDVGCMQISLKHHPKAFSSLEQAFSPRENISYGAQFLRKKYEALGSWDKAIGHYHSANQERGVKYSAKVYKIASNMQQYKALLRSYYKSSTSFVSSERLKTPIMLVNSQERKSKVKMIYAKNNSVDQTNMINNKLIIADRAAYRYSLEEYGLFRKKRKQNKINNITNI